MRVRRLSHWLIALAASLTLVVACGDDAPDGAESEAATTTRGAGDTDGPAKSAGNGDADRSSAVYDTAGCEMLPAQDVEAALGQSIVTTDDDGGPNQAGCNYNVQTGSGVSLIITDAQYFELVRAYPEAESVSGLGDDALWLPGALYVLQGPYNIGIEGPPEFGLDGVRPLMETVLNNLPNGDDSTPAPAVSDGGGEDTSRESLGLDVFSKGVAGALDAESYEITSQTSVRFVFAEGTSDAPHRIECTSASIVLPEGTEITLVYPDGELACD